MEKSGNAITPPSSRRILKGATFQIEKSAPIYGGNADEAILIRSLPPLVGKVSTESTKGAKMK